MSKRFIEILSVLDIRECYEPNCDNYQLNFRSETRDFIHRNKDTDTDKDGNAFMINCQNVDCSVVACSLHADNLIHSTENFWYCKNCFEKEEPLEMLVNNCNRYESYLCIPETKIRCKKDNCICRGYLVFNSFFKNL